MEKEKLESQLIDYIDGNLSLDEKGRMERAISEDAEVRKIYNELKEVMTALDNSNPLVVPPGLQVNFEQWLSSEVSDSRPVKRVYLNPLFLRIAASVALVVSGIAVGFWLSRQDDQEKEIQALKREMELTRQVILSRLNNTLSPSERIMGVKTVSTKDADDEIVDALIRTMNGDSNSNVRLAAINALGNFHDEEKVRRALIESLYHQTDPVVQLTLIQWMVVLKEKAAIGPLQHIIEDANSLQSVRDEAYAGIFKLS